MYSGSDFHWRSTILPGHNMLKRRALWLVKEDWSLWDLWNIVLSGPRILQFLQQSATLERMSLGMTNTKGNFQIYKERVAVAFPAMNFLLTIVTKAFQRGWPTGSASMHVCHQGWWPECDPQDLHGGKRAPTPGSCPLTSTCAPRPIGAYMCWSTHAHRSI